MHIVIKAKTIGAGLKRKLFKFRQDQSGSTLVMLALAVIPMVAFMGIGVDVARGYMVKSKLSAALDAAGLAGGKAFNLSTRDDDIRMFFKANFPEGYMGAKVTGPEIIVNSDEEKLTVKAAAQIDTSFMRVLGFETLDVSSETEVARRQTALDVVLSMDLSGSMAGSAPGGGSRISAARSAALELVNIIFGDSTQKDYAAIGLVPWSGKTNVTLNDQAFDPGLTQSIATPTFTNPVTGASQSEVYLANNSPVPLLSPPPSGWKGCVFNRYLNDGDDTNDADIFFGTGTYGSKNWTAWEPVGPEGEPVYGWGKCSLAVWNIECTPCLSHGITPLTHTKQTIVDAIQALTSPEGSTNIPEGLGWAWRVLLPDAPFTEAEDIPDMEKTRAIVLLTDGENFGTSGDGYKMTFGYGIDAGTGGMDDRLKKLADNIKASGVVIYTIQFANSGTNLQTLMKSIASGPDAPYYHYAPDTDSLQAIFKEVATHISELRLSR